MNVTAKVLCQLTILLVAFLGQSIAKYSSEYEFDDRGNPDLDFFGTDSRYSEFIDDETPHGDSYGAESPTFYGRDKRDTGGRAKRTVEFGEKKKNKYEKEHEWNAEEIQVEEGEDAPFEGEEFEEDTKKKSKTRTIRNADYQTQYKYKNHRYEDDAVSEESRPSPRTSRGMKTTSQYEVHEISEEEEEPQPSESRVPEVLYHGGAQYVRVPDQHRHAVHGAGAPPLARYTGDQSSAASGKPHGHHQASGGGHHQASGGGHTGHDAHKNTHGHKDDKGHKSFHHIEHGSKGKEGHVNHAKHYDEHGGKKQNEHDAAKHYGEHHEAAHGKKGGKFDEKKGHKKGHNTKGYHNKYHRDEYHKEHKFYDDYHKSGSHEKYGDFNAKHAAKEGGHHKKAHHDSASHEQNSGKKGQHDKGHVDEAHKGHKSEKGHQQHHAHHSDYAKKGGHQGGKTYGYKTGH